MYGPDRMYNEFTELGYVTKRIEKNRTVFVVIPDYEIMLGRFKGRIIDLGIQATADFPITVSPAIHVKASPQLYEKEDSLSNVRNIIDSPLGPEWRYWSKNFLWNKEKSARRLMNQIKGIFNNA